ncbi:MAG: glutamate synthase large subunit [Chloroflexi bacterium]|nr:glutamate synthase large subunit [Chloroflexota bacterium]
MGIRLPWAFLPTEGRPGTACRARPCVSPPPEPGSLRSHRFVAVSKGQQAGLYRPEFEHSACGVGVVANIKGVRSHAIIDDGIEVLVNLAHRGARGADPDTGDGAGMLLQMPDGFMRREAAALGFELPAAGGYAVGMTFLPRSATERATCEAIVEAATVAEGQRFLGWRDVPVDATGIGHAARDCAPAIRQFFVGRGADTGDTAAFERKLFVIRKVIERDVLDAGIEEAETFYVCSLSSKVLVLKGLLLGTQLKGFFRDLSDPELVSSFALVHSRFSTNTLGSWKLAHPYRYIVHNGEINTLRGNINWMAARERTMSSPAFGDDMEKLFPIIWPGQSDTACIDNAFELMMHTGRPIHHVMMALIPEATGERVAMDQEKRDFYDYHACTMEPWDGPALIAFTDGERVGAVLDRNGLRPFRYLVTTDDRLVMASEVGVLDIPPEQVLFKERIHPGRMFLLDPERGGIIDDAAIKSELSQAQPYGQWLRDNLVHLDELPSPDPSADGHHAIGPGDLVDLQQAFGYTREELRMLLEPMAVDGGEAIGSMGNDAPLAVLSERPQLLFNYFKQLFAQVSNPPLDAIREELVTSLSMSLGAQLNLFEETPEHARQLKLAGPVITDEELAKIAAIDRPGLKAATLSMLFDPHAAGEPGAAGEALERALDALCREASAAIEAGSSILILSDRGVDADHAPIPSLLATASVHHHLIREGTRTRVGLVVESGEPREVAHLALLIGYGAGAVNPYLVFRTIEDMLAQGLFPDGLERETASKNYIKAANKGLLKIISKMGISTLHSYRGAQVFEAVGLSDELVDRHFTWTASRIGGIGTASIEADALRRHRSAYAERELAASPELDPGGDYYWRRDGEYHMWNPDTVAKLQQAATANDAKAYDEFAALANEYEQRMCTLRGLLAFKPTEPVPIDEVEPATDIVKRFATGAISLGAIGPEAHESLAIAMNRIGARSNSGEGGEDYRRYAPDANGDRRHSAIKQVASGRFGVTANYLVNASDLQIKMAQGSKPGEGGQLPGHKIDDYIAWVRNSTPGVELISPPPHHDIYSIEDLAQLIHDLKNTNPAARIHVKLVAEVGVGTIAAGVSKAHGDVVLISGDTGGTGASPESSIKHAGLPWELGIAEAQQVLVANGLRGRIVVQADGQIKTGRDIAIACLLGADEFGIATASLVTQGCIMLRKCHLNTCSVGIATQDPELRKRFAGKPESLINYFFFLAEELRGIMAQLGFRTVNEMVGRVDMLDTAKAIDHWQKTKGIDLGGLLMKPEPPEGVATYHCESQDHGLELALDHQLIAASKEAIEGGEPVSIELPIRNANRTVGAMLSGEVAKRYGEDGLPPGTIQASFTGSAGQSFAAFLTKGISFTLEGDTNDYVGKGISGGQLIIVPPKQARFVPEETIIIGNVALYGATGGDVFIRGLAGERFCVRNSGANAVIEGIGDHGCEYMTNGRVVVLGPTGRNFAAGMSGGIAYVLDEAGDFDQRANTEMVDLEPVVDPEDVDELRRLIQAHLQHTGSATAKRVLDGWDVFLPRFVKVYPRDYRRVIEARKRAEAEAVTSG